MLMSQRKFRNTKYDLDGMTFDSKKEAERYAELKMMERAGEIRELRTQVPFILIPSQKDEQGKCIEREAKYIADFAYRDAKTNRLVVEDVKSAITRKQHDYILKRKLMLYRHGIRIKEV